MHDQPRIEIHCEADLKKHARTILRRVERSERGGLLYLLNPVFALQDEGFDLSLEMRRHLKRALRYGTDDKKRLRKLERSIAKDAGREIHAASNSQVAELLFDQLKLVPPALAPEELHEDLPDEAETYESELELLSAQDDKNDKVDKADKIDYSHLTARQLQDQCAQRQIKRSGTKAILIARLEKEDGKRTVRPPVSLALLEKMRDAHPIIPKLIELRVLLRDGWQFANRQTYEKVKAGATVTLLRGMKFRRRRRGGTHDGEGGL